MTQVPEGLNNDIEEPLRGRLERDPAAVDGPAEVVEDGAAYERAVEEDTVIGPDGDMGPADDEGPMFQEPGEDPR